MTRRGRAHHDPADLRAQNRWLLLTLSLGMTLVLSIPLALVAVPHVRRAQMLSRLTSADLKQRHQALNYMARNIEHPRVLPGAVRALAVPDEANFVQLVQVLDMVGRWRREHIPLDPWLRWIELLGDDQDPESRILAAQAVADLTPDHADPRLANLLGRWITDSDERVRFNALVASAELAGVAADRKPYEALLAQATSDAQKQIAREAWLLLGLLDPEIGVRGNWEQAALPVAAAMLWSTVRSHPGEPVAALEALEPTRPPALRAAAMYALGLSDAPAARQAIAAQLQIAPNQVDEFKQVITWRAMMSADADSATRWLEPQAVRSADPLAAPIIFAAANRFPGALVQRIDVNDLAAAPITLLAVLEGWDMKRDGPLAVQLPDPAPDLLQLAAAAVARDVTAVPWRQLLELSQAPLRDAACVIAIDRLSRDELSQLVEALITSFDDRGKMSGAMLSGLTGLHADLLRKRAAKEDVWSVRMVQQMGLWMQGQQPADATFTLDNALGLLTRDDLPTSSVLLALLQREPKVAMDYLLTPRADERMFRAIALDPEAPADSEISLLTLLDQYRWWRVLSRYLPPEAPRLNWWADADAKQFSVDLLRDWHLLHRHRR
jgi:hypothetical protein